MRTPWKILISLAVVLPLGGFVAGSLATPAAPEPAPRETIVIRDAETRSPDPSPTTSTSGPAAPADDHASPGPEVVTPSLDDLGDDHGGERGDDHGGDGSGSGHGGGADDSGGGGHG